MQEKSTKFPANLITKRPDGMPFDNYRETLKQQKRLIKSKFNKSPTLEYGISALMFSPRRKEQNRANEVANAKRPKPTNFTSKKPNRK